MIKALSKHNYKFDLKQIWKETQEMITIQGNVNQKSEQEEKPKWLDVHKCILGDIYTFSLNVNNKKINVEIYMWVKLNFPMTEKDFCFACDIITF